MKKKIILLLLTFLLIPKFTFAEELPREGVHYFMDFPNNEEVVTKNYDETGERLIYSGKTNENGEVVLEDWNEEGELRIVQVVPNGYKTEHKELIVDLKNKKASFVDYREANLINPSTGQSILLILITIIVIGSLIYTIITKDKKALIPIIILILVQSIKVLASNNNFVITVQDRVGNPLKDVEIEIYAKPKNIEASPAIEIKADGGLFLNGKDTYYIKIPYNNMTPEDFNSIENETDALEMEMNLFLIYKEGYKVDVNNIQNMFSDTPTVYSNDTVINLTLTEDPNIKYATVHANGGKFKGSKKGMDEIKLSLEGLMIIEKMQSIGIDFIIPKTNNAMIGYDNNASCTNYNQYGVPNNNIESIFIGESGNMEIPDDLYLCWRENPDGIYINGKYLFPGNTDNCYNNSITKYVENDYRSKDEINKLEIDLNIDRITFCELHGTTVNSYNHGGATIHLLGQNYDPLCSRSTLETLKVVEKGQTVLDLGNEYFHFERIEPNQDVYNHFKKLDSCLN